MMVEPHLKDLEKSFGRQMVLDHVGFDLQPGEIRSIRCW